MEESAKETVIIVHGTWAAPGAGASRWYQPVDGVPPAEGFVSKLNAALQERKSPARCWAHCTQGNQIFHWSGDNNWILRTYAASALADYVAKLRNEGWRCHIVAHSHGGNVVVEALHQIMAAQGSSEPQGKIVTLGTPFMDTMSSIAKRSRRAGRILNAISWTNFVVVMFGLAGYISYSFAHREGIADYFSHWWNDLAIIAFLFFIALLLPQTFGRKKRTDLWATFNGSAQSQPPFLAIGSPTDEAWQILHHVRTIDNPLAVRSNLLSYLFSSLRFHISQNAEVARIHGAKSYQDLGFAARLVMAFTHLLTALILFTVVLLMFIPPDDKVTPGIKMYIILSTVIFFGVVLFMLVLFITKLMGETFYSAFLSPFRWCVRHLGSLTRVGPAFGTYVVLRWSWPVLLKVTMGLEGYRFKTPPFITQYPSHLPEKFVKYENLPRGAEERALAERSAWIARHLGGVSQTFSKMVLTAADLSLLLQTVEEDRTLVHAAYYTDDECIARIADWIADKG
jgi:hypothetical protein